MATNDLDDSELGSGWAQTLSPVMASGANWEDVLASGDPQKYMATFRPGAPAMHVAAPPLLPATNAPNPPSETTSSPAVPATVSPSGTATPSLSRFNRDTLAQAQQATQSALDLARSRTPVDVNAIEAQRTALAAPQSATNPTGVPNPKDPLHPEYRPSVGRRIARGVIGAAAGLAGGGLRGALLGAVQPQAFTGTSYGAPTSRFQQAALRNQQATQSLDQQLQQADTQNKTKDQGVQNLLSAGKQLADIATAGSKAEKSEAAAGEQDVQLGKAGLRAVRDENGNITSIKADPDSPITKAHQAQDDFRAAQQEEAEATAALRRAQNDPNSPAYRQAQQRIETARANAAAAATRANAYAMNAFGANLGTTPQGQELPGATETAGGTPMGSRFQSGYTKNQQNVAQFNDVLGATDQLEGAARNLVKAHGRGALSSPIIAAGIAQPESTFRQWLQGQVANGGMTPAQRDYVTNLRAFRENLQALRKSAGGGVSDAQVNRLMEMAPGASTPDLDYLLRQTGQIRNTANRLSEGIPNVAGGHRVGEGRNSRQTPAAPAGASAEVHQGGPNGPVIGHVVNGRYVPLAKQ